MSGPVAPKSAGAPPYPASERAKGYRFELDYERVLQSDTWAVATPVLQAWLLKLWFTAWCQSPCGSLPGDDALITARIGMSGPAFAKARGTLLRGWWLADDGRLYHPVITERVLEMRERKLSERERKAAWRAKKNSGGSGAAQVPSRPAFVPRDTTRTGAGLPRESGGSDATGTGNGTGTGSGFSAPESARVSRARSQEGKGDAAAGLAARICEAMGEAGMPDVEQGDPRLLRLIADGATVAEFEAVAREAEVKGKSLAWAFVALAGRRKDAATLAAPAGTKLAITVGSQAVDETKAYLEKLTMSPEQRAAASEARARALQGLRELGVAK